MTVVPDYSYSRFSGARLRQLGFGGVMRYACEGRGSVNITAPEAHDLMSNGIAIGITTEHEQDWLLHDPREVESRVRGAVAVTRAAGLPDGVIALACDFDVTLGGPPVSQRALANMDMLLRGLEAAAQVLGGDIGLYGGYYAIDWVSKNSWVGHYWQTIGWSAGLLHPKASLYQDRVNTYLDGQGIDFSTVEGNWAPRGQVNPPKPQPPHPPASIDVRGIQRSVHATADGVWGPETDRNCELVRLSPHCSIGALQQYALGFSGRDVDGICGPKTVLADLAAIQGIQHGLRVPADGKWGPQTQAAYVAASPFR